MPRYEYYCKACENTVLIQHLSDEEAGECPKCAAKAKLEKLVTEFRTMYPIKPTKKKRTGELTKEFIKDAAADLKRQRKMLDEDR